MRYFFELNFIDDECAENLLLLLPHKIIIYQ